MISDRLSGRPSSDESLSSVSRSLDSVAGESMCSIRKAAISAQLVGPLGVGAVGALDDRVGPAPEEGAIGVGDTEHLGDHRDGDGRGHRVDEVDHLPDRDRRSSTPVTTWRIRSVRPATARGVNCRLTRPR